MYKILKISSHPTVDFAAEELKKYLRMMMPRAGEIKIKYNPHATEGFRLGLMSDFSLDTSEAQDTALDDIIHIDTDAEGGIISGSNTRSILLAVYKYLALNGCRWLFPGIDGELIPTKDIEPTKYHKMADNRIRGWCNEGAEFQQAMLDAIDFAPKIGLNVFMLEFFNPHVYYRWYYDHPHNANNREPEPVTYETVLQWKRQCEAEIAKRSLQFHDIGHGWIPEALGINTQVGWKKDEENPIPDNIKKYLAMTDGKRDLYHGIALNTNLCFSNEEARKIVINYICDYAQNNGHVDYLHFWLADGFNNHCECEKCREKTPSDWYVITLNELDKELTRRGLATRIVFCAYVDTTWPPETEKIDNPDRFSLLLGAITRDYTSSVASGLSDVKPTKYTLNSVELPKTLDEYVYYAKEWQKRCKTSMFAYEYHFYVNQYRDPGSLSIARVLRDDIIGYNKHGFSGIIQDGTQRPFFPNGFSLYAYASTLFDVSLEFDALLEDYFSHAYGEDWQTARDYLVKIEEIFEHSYIAGKKYEESGNAKFLSPKEAAKMRKIYSLNEEFSDFLETHKNMPKRAQTVAVRLLAKYSECLEKLAKPLILKAYGLDDEAKYAYLEFLDDFGKNELEIEAYYDQHIFGMAYDHRFTKLISVMNIADA